MRIRKLTERDVNAIRSLYSKGVSLTNLAHAFDVDISSIYYQVNEGCRARKRGRYLKSLVSKTSDREVVNVASNYIDSIKG